MINSSFLEQFTFDEQEKLKDIVYGYYVRCGSRRSRKLDRHQYFVSQHVKYKFVYAYCPRCKSFGLLLYPFKKSALDEIKYCVRCGESNIQYRFTTGLEKIDAMIQVSKLLDNLKLKDVAYILNQQIVVLIVSVYEVYLRDCYAGIMNTMYVRDGETLFEKFLKDCKNDFLNPGKTNRRLEKELKINLKSKVGSEVFKKLVELVEYRNVIVHNNGICDKKFLALNIGNYMERDIIKLDLSDISYYLHAIKEAINVLDAWYEEIVKKHIIKSIKDRIAANAEPLLPLYLPPRI